MVASKACYYAQIHDLPLRDCAPTQTSTGVVLSGPYAAAILAIADDDAGYLAWRRERVWEQIKAHREQRRAGGVYVQNHWYHSDSDSKLQFVELKANAEKVLAAGGTAETILQANIPGVGLVDITWKPVESFARVSMTAGLALAIVEAITVAEMINFNTADTHRLAMIAASNLLTSDPGYIAPEAYDYSTDWTGSYSA